MNKQSSAITDQKGHPISLSTANPPDPGEVMRPLSALDELACDLSSTIELLSAAEDLCLYREGDGPGNPIHAVLSRALEELRGQHEVLCALL